jgi:ArsR family transcriptional regulator
MQALVFYKSLADETRLKILLLLHVENELCVCELIEALALSQPKISRHLALLREQGLVSTRKSGQWVFYALHEQLPAWTLANLNDCYRANSDYIEANLALLRAMVDRPEKCCN